MERMRPSSPSRLGILFLTVHHDVSLLSRSFTAVFLWLSFQLVLRIFFNLFSLLCWVSVCFLLAIVVPTEEEGWWQGTHMSSGAKGLLPANYVEEISLDSMTGKACGPRVFVIKIHFPTFLILVAHSLSFHVSSMIKHVPAQ